MEEKRAFTRRNALSLGAVAAASAAFALTGCSTEAPTNDAGFVEFDLESGVLPLGSVVVLDDGCEPEIARLIIARRPVYIQDEHVYDYAGVVWPIGIISDIAGEPFPNEIHLFDAKAIKGVRFVGYEGALEADAAARLKDSAAQDESSLESLLPLAMEMGVVELSEDVEL